MGTAQLWHTYTPAGKTVIHLKVNLEKNEDDCEKEQSVCEMQLLGNLYESMPSLLFGPKSLAPPSLVTPTFCPLNLTNTVTPKSQFAS